MPLNVLVNEHRLYLPLAFVVTPNIPEAEVLLGRDIRGLEAMRAAALELCEMGAQYAVVKGGHSDGPAVDVVAHEDYTFELSADRVETINDHGTGCTFSAAIAACLALGLPPRKALARAKWYLTGALKHAPSLGDGHGPVHHFWAGVPKVSDLPA